MGQRKVKQLVLVELFLGLGILYEIYSTHNLEKSTCPQLHSKDKLQIAQRSSKWKIMVISALQ